MNVRVFESKNEMGAAAAAVGVEQIQAALEGGGDSNFIVATGASQFDMLERLRQADLPWPKLTGFHLDEYVGLTIEHGASFRKYLWERFVSQLPLPLKAFHFLDGESDPEAECERVGNLIRRKRIDVAFVGIGENGHLAFNDPPADFETDEPYLLVNLDEACRRQQLGEGWFPDLESVPKQAISMSIHQILLSQMIVCTVPDERKAQAVKNALRGPVTPDVPASILQTHPNCHFFLDKGAASLL